jgi:hypothetical protein
MNAARALARRLSPLGLVAAVLAGQEAPREASGPPLLPRDEEVSAALAAGPPHVAAGAGVYVLTATGYELVRSSSNGFHCLVERSFPGAFEPQCFDAEGSRTLMQATLLAARLRAGGAPRDEVERRVAAAWAAGELRAPGRPGINYMLSTENRVPVDPSGERIVPYGPHLMFYAPYLRNEDLGSDGGPGSPLFVINEGMPGAYVIVPVASPGRGHGG